MSLYGGIKFALTKPGEQAAADERQEQSNTAGQPSSASAAGPSKQPQALKVAGKNSAALKFAPRIRQAKPAGRAPPPVSATTYSAEPVFIDTQQPSSRPDHSNMTTTTVMKEEIVLGADGRPLAKAPAMTLAAAKRARGGGEEERKKKKKKKRRRQQPVMSDFKPDEQYDPNRPNDLAEYQYYRKKLREERRTQLIEAKKRQERGGSSGESSYYTDSEEDVPRRDAPKTWAPPKIYDAPPAAQNRQAEPIRPPAPATAQSNSGDDAYARRLAMSQATLSGDDAFARRQALSAGLSHHQAPPPRSLPQADAIGPPIHFGDDAYARRMAMSASQQPQTLSPPPPSNPMFASSAGSAIPPPPPPPDMPPFPPSSRPQPIFDVSGIPGFGTPPPTMPSHSAPPAENSTTAPDPSTSVTQHEDFARLLEEKRKAAASIAEKLSNLGPPAATPPSMGPVPASEPDNGGGTFAEKMMRKWGHKEGTGLGADGSGIVHALTAEHVAKPVDPNQPLSKRQLAKQKAAAANAKSKNRKWVQHATNRGKIVNAADAERKSEEVIKYGEASRIICLVGLVGSEDEIDEDLSEEIGEECSKYGIVERVVQHLVEPPPLDPAECLRVFVVFSGMAGAWRNIRELDGRFFGGRKIRATYMDEARFDRGERDGPLL